MSEFEELTGVPQDFCGVARLFPLPNSVMFPHVMQPLHIFEPRYVELLRDVLATDQLITMALLSPGWEAGYQGRPPIEQVCCLGKVVTHVPAKDGGHNILLLGLQRVAIESELPPARSYREAKVTLLDDDYPSSGDKGRAALRRGLLGAFRRFLPETDAAREQFEQLMSTSVPLGVLTDIIAFTLSLPLDCKQCLLNQTNVDVRATRLISELERIAGAGAVRLFPPEFSTN